MVAITQEGETKNFWIFKNQETGERYDISKDQLALAFIHLKEWQTHGGNNFSCKLFDLMCKADAENFRKIFNGFPARTTAYILWYLAPDKEVLFNKYLVREPVPGCESDELAGGTTNGGNYGKY